MNRFPLIAAGVMATVLLSLCGLVLIPNWQYQDLDQYEDEMGQMRPVRPAGNVLLGRRVYIDLGCIYCHSQQVRPEGYGADLDRGWGIRRTVARDYFFDSPPLMGTMRTGPDLANIGSRQPSTDWHYLHLYNPEITSLGSVMPQFPFLFEVLKESDRIPNAAVQLPENWVQEPTWIFPTERAVQLVEYLTSLDHSYSLPEVP